MTDLTKAVDIDERLPPDDPHWRLVQRIASSRYFRKSQKMREFLLYVCEKSLAQRTDDIREQQIGSAVFGRRPDYNPGDDSIVRTEAWEMRRRLERYFSSEGRHEPVILTIPKGSYVPVFATRGENGGEDHDPGNSRERNDLETAKVESPLQEDAEWGKRVGGQIRSNLVWAASLFLLLPLIWLGWDDLQLRKQANEVAGPGFPVNSIWENLFDDGHDTKIVLGDSSLVSYQHLSLEEVGLDDYSSLRYLTRINDPILKWVADYALVNVNAAVSAARIGQRNRQHWQRMQVQFARDLKVQDLRSNHLILIGSRYSVRWIDLFDDRLNFFFDFKTSEHPSINAPAFINRKPMPGETESYTRRRLEDGRLESYGVIAYLPNLNSTGNVLMLSGLTAADCEGITEYLINPEFQAAFPPELTPAMNGGHWPHFELLVKTKYFQNVTTSKVSPVAFRILRERPS